MLYMIELIGTDQDFKVTKFLNREDIAKYVKNSPGLLHDEYIIIEGELQHSKGRHIYDGRFQ